MELLDSACQSLQVTQTRSIDWRKVLGPGRVCLFKNSGRTTSFPVTVFSGLTNEISIIPFESLESPKCVREGSETETVEPFKIGWEAFPPGLIMIIYQVV